MKKLLFPFLLIIFSLFPLLPSDITAQEEETGTERSEPFLGQKHFYSVTFRDNGEAVVAFRVALTNTSSVPLDTITLIVPKVKEPSNLTSYQIFVQGYCLQYEPRNDSSYDFEDRECLQYSEPDSYGNYNRATYGKASADYADGNLTVKLPVSIEPNEQGTFLVYFRTFGYTLKNAFGAYSYEFETLKTDDFLSSIEIGINTASDLHMKKAKGSSINNYGNPTPQGLSIRDEEVIESTALDDYINDLGNGRITKTASDLTPLDSYTVKGMYSDSLVKLYAKEFVIALILFLLFILVLLAAARYVIKRHKKSAAQVSVQKESRKDVVEDRVTKAWRNFFTALGISFVTAFVMVAYLVGVIVILMGLDSGLVSYDLAPIVRFALGFFSFVVLVTLLVGPSVYFGSKRGLGWGVLTSALFIFWMFSLFLLFLFLIYLPARGGGSTSSFTGPF